VELAATPRHHQQIRRGGGMTWRPSEEATERSIRNVVVDGRRTSFRLEKAFWDAIEDFASEKGITRHQLIAEACENQERDGVSMSSAVRVYLIREAMLMADGQSGESPLELASGGGSVSHIGGLAQSLMEAVKSAEMAGRRPGGDPDVQRIYGRLGSLLMG
jgi:predicted DNA-binding ribbon-helix-helix protein